MKAIFLLGLLCAGCAREIAEPRYQITDLTSGRHYVCESRDMHKTSGGISFRDENTGDSVALTNVETRRIEDARYKGHYDAWDGIWVTDERVYPAPVQGSVAYPRTP